MAFLNQHHGVLVQSLFSVDSTTNQGLADATNHLDRCLEFVSDGIDERIVLFVATYLADQKSRVQYDAEDQYDKENNAENQQRDFTPVENNPTDIQRHGECDEARTERNEERH